MEVAVVIIKKMSTSHHPLNASHNLKKTGKDHIIPCVSERK